MVIGFEGFFFNNDAFRRQYQVALMYLVLINIICCFFLNQQDLETVLNFQNNIWEDQHFAFLFFWNISTLHFPIRSSRFETLLKSPTIVELYIFVRAVCSLRIVSGSGCLINGKSSSRNGEVILKQSIYLMLLSLVAVLCGLNKE